MNQNRSVATIDAPEFINLKPNALNPGISECEIKVLYLGENRNHSFIDKNTAIQMANSLPGCPIVGAYIEKKEDFGDHGHVMTIEDGEVHFSCKTVPYGFIDPNAQVWFQNFIDTDDFGNEIKREYLMTTGFLWTGQFEEAQSIISEGKGQSMELEEKSLEGHWATNNKTGIEFFIINDAVFTKLCILGDDVEPCFEGAAITEPEVSKNFSYNKVFSNTLFTMMNELKDALQNKGGANMPKPDTLHQQQEEAVENISVEEASDTDFACGTDKKKKYADSDKDEDKDKKSETQEEESEEEAPAEEKSEEQEKKKEKIAKNTLEEVDFAQLQDELKELREFKHEIENQKKDALINKYHMLSDEDKIDVITHKEEYSLEEIEAKLALIYVNKNVDFSTITGEKEQENLEQSEETSTTFSLENQDVAGSVPDYVEALRLAKEF